LELVARGARRRAQRTSVGGRRMMLIDTRSSTNSAKPVQIGMQSRTPCCNSRAEGRQPAAISVLA
jgi:hypothetical protein